MSAVDCPHCTIPNDLAAAFCASCGKAMPIQSSGGPRMVKGTQLAKSAAGQELQVAELVKKMKSARTTLLVVGVLQALVGIGMFFFFNSPANNDPRMMAVGIAVAIVGFIFTGLGIWSTWAPFPAALTGLVIFITLIVADAVADPLTLLQGWIIKVVVIVALAKAVSAGMQHRQLRRQMQQTV